MLTPAQGASLSQFKLFPLPACQSDLFQFCKTSIESRKAPRLPLPSNTSTPGRPTANNSPVPLADDFASPGYFSTNLSFTGPPYNLTGSQSVVRVELTSLQKTALQRFTFDGSIEHPRMVVDISNDGGMTSSEQIMTLDPATGRVSGKPSVLLVADVSHAGLQAGQHSPRPSDQDSTELILASISPTLPKMGT